MRFASQITRFPMPAEDEKAFSATCQIRQKMPRSSPRPRSPACGDWNVPKARGECQMASRPLKNPVSRTLLL
jgi:hypothetical protein